MTTVTEERRAKLRDAADAHDQWAVQNLDAPFDPPKDAPDNSVYNQHYVDLNADGSAQDEYATHVAAIMDGDQTASIVDKLGHHHSESDGRFVKKGSAASRALKSGQPDSLAGFSREQLMREVRRRNRDGAEIKLRRGATPDEIKAALHEHEHGPERPFRNTPKQDAAAQREAIRANRAGNEDRSAVRRAAAEAVTGAEPSADEKAQAQANIEGLMKVAQAREKLRRAELMHGRDRSTWTKQNRDAAAKLDMIIAEGPKPTSMAERRAQRDAQDALSARWKAEKAALKSIPKDQQADKLNELTRAINEPGLNPARRMHLEDMRREMNQLMGVKVTTSASPERVRRAGTLAEATKHSNPQPQKVSDLKANSDARSAPGEAQRLADLKARNAANPLSPEQQRQAELRDIDAQLSDTGLSNAVRGALTQRRAELSPSAARGDRRSASAGVAAERIRDLRQQISSSDPNSGDAEEGARVKVEQMLDGLTKPQLAKVAEELRITLIPGQRKEQQVRHIVQAAVGHLIDHRVIMRIPLNTQRQNQTAAIDGDGMEDVHLFEEAFSSALDAAMALGDDAAEEEFAAAFAFEFASRMPERLARWWTEGPGVARVKWFIRGAFRRCRRLLKGEGVPGRMLDGACANLYHRATGRWPGAHKGAQTAALRHEAIANLAIGLEIPAEVLTAGGIDEFAPLESFELEELVDILNEEMNMAHEDDADEGNQIACGCGDAPAAPYTVDDGELLEMSAGDDGVWWWEGPLAPIATPTSDQVPRQFAPDALSSRGLPRALRWQEQADRGHDGAVVVGALTEYSLKGGMPFGRAYFFDEEIIPQAGKARYLTEHGVIAPSVDLEPDMDVAYADPDGNVFSPEVCMKDGTCPAKPRQLITRGTIAAATLVPIAAFAQLGAGRTYWGPAPQLGTTPVNQVAAVRSSGWDDMPIAGRDREWDSGAADQRLTAWATTDGEISWPRYSQAFLWHGDDPASKGAFKFPVADVIDGELSIIPRAVFAAAARLNQADIPADAKNSMRDVLSDLYDQIAEETDDDSIVAPWDDDREEMSVQGCGCAAKMGAVVPDGNQTASAGCGTCGSKYGVFGNMEPYPEDAFSERRFDTYTPLQIEQRPGEPFARLFGHIGDFSGCHRGFKHVCLPPPKSKTNYAEFHTAGHVRVPSGLLRVGKVVMGEGHPDASVSARVARAFYDATSKEVGHVRGYQDKFGPYLNGVVAPGVTPEEATKLLASPPSGDWKAGELIAVLAVNVAGHPVRTEATFGADGQPENMVAAGRIWTQQDDDLADADAVLWEAEHRHLTEVMG